MQEVLGGKIDEALLTRDELLRVSELPSLDVMRYLHFHNPLFSPPLLSAASVSNLSLSNMYSVNHFTFQTVI